MSTRSRTPLLWLSLTLLLLGPGTWSTGAEGSDKEPALPTWHTDYAKAMDLAQRQGRMLLIYFRDPQENELRRRFEAETLSDSTVQDKLQGYVCVRLPLDASIRIEGKDTRLLEHPSFQEMLGTQGVAIVDLVHRDAPYYAAVVSTFPLSLKHWYTPAHLTTILDLPPGTLTQRTLIYAVRVHPEGPASARGRFDAYLSQEAESHADYQARIRVQGHHNWNFRFARICGRLPGGLTAAEVCAESWPGERLVEAAVECVRCWRLSSGHWHAVSTYHPLYAYDMKRGANGIWYATGIFGEGVLAATPAEPKSNEAVSTDDAPPRPRS